MECGQLPGSPQVGLDPALGRAWYTVGIHHPVSAPGLASPFAEHGYLGTASLGVQLCGFGPGKRPETPWPESTGVDMTPRPSQPHGGPADCGVRPGLGPGQRSTLATGVDGRFQGREPSEAFVFRYRFSKAVVPRVAMLPPRSGSHAWSCPSLPGLRFMGTEPGCAQNVGGHQSVPASPEAFNMPPSGHHHPSHMGSTRHTGQRVWTPKAWLQSLGCIALWGVLPSTATKAHRLQAVGSPTPAPALQTL